jgi:pyrroloquinoline quinone (PQQ) biosynthesis protein C
LIPFDIESQKQKKHTFHAALIVPEKSTMQEWAKPKSYLSRRATGHA